MHRQSSVQVWSPFKSASRSKSSWRQVSQRASGIGWEQARSRCTQRRRTWETRCVPSGSVGKHVCWLKCGSRGRVEWWCRRRWRRRWSSAREPPVWRRFQTSLKPRKWCELYSKIVEYLWINGRTKAVQCSEYAAKKPTKGILWKCTHKKHQYLHSVTKKLSIVMTTVWPLNM